ncbi:MAG: MnhB domain-containing protein [Firmicutes bacterium]|jgi:multicomponent Na+:H+ antiporter subunit B|nr:MnhB domain-containing protein [Bacillota bacterium]MBR6351231.1 MnhB domain-containing protein [Bacillota bacterium]
MKFKNGIKEKNIIVKCGADAIMPFSLMFGFYIICFGTISPGGGFQGGVIVAAACILLYLAYGHKTTTTAINEEFIRVNEAIGAVLYVLLGFCGLFIGVRFCENVFYEFFNIGDPLSAGTITYMSYAVGYKVLTGVGFLLLLMIGTLIGGDDDEEEVEA